MFKMADQFITEHEALPNVTPLNRNYVNKSFDAYKRKKEAQKDQLSRGASVSTSWFWTYHA